MTPERSREQLRALAFDLAVAVAAAFFSVSALLSILPDFDPAERAGLVGLALAQTLPLAVRRRRPWPSFGVVYVAGLALALLGLPLVVLGLAPLIAVSSAGS